MTKGRKIWVVICGALLIIFLSNKELLIYGISQLKGQLTIVLYAEPIETVIKQPGISVEWKEKLALIHKIKRFAIDSLGLRTTGNYTTFYNQNNKPVLWVLTGCLPFKFEPFTWNFPILGSVSYKGFFNKENGIKELNQLRSSGYDADLSPTGGWSTLGWFKDPVLSNMLKKKEGVLAELIIHEISHGTIYLKSNVDFNENLATFIGEHGALQFLNQMYGNSSVQLKTYLDYKTDEERFGKYLIKSQNKLKTLYQSFKPRDAEAIKLKAKRSAIKEIISQIDSIPFYNKTRYHFSLSDDSLPDNTFFMSNSRYRKNQDEMTEILQNQFKGNLSAFIFFIKNSDEKVILNTLNIPK